MPKSATLLSGAAVLFLVVDSVCKLLEIQPVIDETVRLGYPPGMAFTLGVLLLACLVLYIIPATSVLGAVLLTGYLGGAVATHARVSDPFFTHTLFPTYVGAMLWGGLTLRDARLQAFFPGHPPITRPLPERSHV